MFTGRNSKVLFFGALVCFLSVGASSRAVAGVLDPGFESAVAKPYSVGAIGDGWNVLQGVIIIIDNSQSLGTAHSGQRFADLDNGGTPNSLSQTLATVSGQSYTISFWLSDDVGGNPFQVTFGATTLFNSTTPALGSGNYEFLTFSALAGATTTDLTFTSHFTAKIPGVGAVIDDVAVTAATVPEPSALSLAGIGVAMLSIVALRKRFYCPF